MTADLGGEHVPGSDVAARRSGAQPWWSAEEAGACDTVIRGIPCGTCTGKGASIEHASRGEALFDRPSALHLTR